MCGGLMSRVDFLQAHSNEDDSSITAVEATLPAHKRISVSGWKHLPPSYIDLRGGISFFVNPLSSGFWYDVALRTSKHY
jgi:hypothetical protein